jgi:hypothetical protein
MTATKAAYGIYPEDMEDIPPSIDLTSLFSWQIVGYQNEGISFCT